MNQKQIFTEYWKILDTLEDYMNDGFRRERLDIPRFKLDRNKEVPPDPLSCSACNLHEHSSIRSHIRGEGKKRLLIINRALPVSYATQEVQFNSNEEGFLSKWLEAIGLDIDKDCKIVPLVFCPVLDNAEVSMEHIRSCAPFLMRIIEETQPQAILVLGKEREKYFREKINSPLYVSHHPADVLKDLSLKRPVWEVLKQIKDVFVGE